MEKILLAFPLFGMLLLIEFAYGYFKNRNTYSDIKDSFASLSLGLGNVIFSILTTSFILAIDMVLHEHRLFNIGNTWFEIILLFVIMDFSFYWWHRASHKIRFFWANHVNHHSSTQFNFTTAFRQPLFSPIMRPLFYFYIPFLGFDPSLMVIIGIVQLAWAVWSHTQLIGKLGFLEWILVTPSNHRVHHGSNAIYIDKNYGGIFIFWDIMFGTFETEKEPVKYGITSNIKTYNPFTIIFHEWKALIADIKKSKTIKEAFDYTFRPPQ